MPPLNEDGMRLVVEPADGLVDQIPEIRVEGAPNGIAITLTITTTDAAGRRWQSSTPISDGVSGNTDQSEPWWSMEFASEGVPPVAFTAPPDQLEYQLLLLSGQDDQMWPSVTMADSIMARLTELTITTSPSPTPATSSAHRSRPPLCPGTTLSFLAVRRPATHEPRPKGGRQS